VLGIGEKGSHTAAGACSALKGFEQEAITYALYVLMHIMAAHAREIGFFGAEATVNYCYKMPGSSGEGRLVSMHHLG
jgi:hypothetical protein